MKDRLSLLKPHVAWSLTLVLTTMIPAWTAAAGPVAKHHEKHPPRAHLPVTQASGVVTFFNHSPKGPCDSLILKSGDKLIQANFPPDAGPRVMNAVKVGERITVAGVPDKKKGDHMVLRIAKITKQGSATLDLGPPHPPGPKGHEKLESLHGKIAHWNYARGGEINGVVLDTGDFIHLGPHGVAELDLQLGQRFTAVGNVRPLPGAHQMIEHPVEVNGKHFGPPHPAPPEKGHGKHHKKPPKKKHEKGHHGDHEHKGHHEHHGEHEHHGDHEHD